MLNIQARLNLNMKMHKWDLHILSEDEKFIEKLKVFIVKNNAFVMEAIPIVEDEIFDPSAIKDCTSCGLSKKLSLYSLSKGGAMGRRPRCKQCEKEERDRKAIEVAQKIKKNLSN